MTAKASSPSPVKTTPQMWLLALALATPILLLPCGRDALTPLALLALLGLFMFFGLLRHRQSFNTEDRALQVLPRCFLFIWLPMLVSALDADVPAQVLAAAKWYPLYGLMALAVVVLLRATAALRQLAVILSWIVGIWAFDGLAQTGLGIDMFNTPINADGQAQAFFANGSRLGFYLGVLATVPLYTLHLLGANRLSHLLLTTFMLCAVLILGPVESWVMTGWALLPYMFLVYINSSARPLAPILVLPVWLGLVFMGCLHFSANTQHQLAHGLALWSLDAGQSAFGATELAQLWQISTEIFTQYWFNGVGAGQFGAAFQPYMAPHAVSPAGVDVSHPHQFILQILVSTGIVGALALVLVWAALWRLWQRATPAQHKLALPVLMPVAALWWPFNSHQNFYSTELAALTFFLLALAIAALTSSGEAK